MQERRQAQALHKPHAHSRKLDGTTTLMCSLRVASFTRSSRPSTPPSTPHRRHKTSRNILPTSPQHDPMLESFFETLEALRQDKTAAAIFVATVVVTVTFFYWLTKDPPLPKGPGGKEAGEEPDPPRNFTAAQLREFTGAEKDEPIYVALQGEVFDVSSARDFYGPEGVYGGFAGHDVTRAFALNSLEEKDLDNPDLDDLTYSAKESLHGWVEKYKYYKCYPIVGRLVTPPSGLKLTTAELTKHKGEEEKEGVPEGWAAAPIYVAVKGQVFDMSFGGRLFYGPGGPYHFLAGKDGSRPLAKMSFEKADAESRDLSDLTDRQRQTLDEWVEKFTNGRKYPVVGTLVD